MDARNRIKRLLLALLTGAFTVAPVELIASSAPSIDIWLDRGDGGVYYPGDAMTVYFKVDRSAYVTVYNIDTDGYVHILYPYYPGMDNYVAGGKTYTIPGGGYDLGLYTDEPTGSGYMEAVVSEEPFYLDDWPFLSQSDESDEGVEVIRRITGDPFLSIEEINQKILPFSEDIVYGDDFAIYYVNEVVHYPRYICSDCHVPSYYHYEPYDYYCPSYYIVVYDYWYYNDFCYWDFYYPYDYYGYYYRFPRSSHDGRRYTRKYDYRTRDEGVYQTKGESQLSPGAIRVREHEGSTAGGVVTPVTVPEAGNGSGSSPVHQEKTTVREYSGDIPVRTGHVTVDEGGGPSVKNDTVTRRSGIRGAADDRTGPGTKTRVSVDEGERSSQGSGRIEKRGIREDGDGVRFEYRTRAGERVTGGDRTEGRRTFRSPARARVPEGRSVERRNPAREPVRVAERRPEPGRDSQRYRSDPRVTGSRGHPVSHGIRESGGRTAPGTEVRRGPSMGGRSPGGFNRGTGARRPSTIR